MIKLGLIGGIGPESTLLYYRKLVYAAQQKVGGHFFPNLTIESLNVFDVLKMCQLRDYEGLTHYLMGGINNLIAAGADVVALTGNTPHIVFNELQKKSVVPLISIVDSTRDEALSRNISKIGLLGTRITMEEDFFKQPFIRSGIDVVIPSADEIDFIARKISQELEFGLVVEQTQSAFVNIIERMHKEEGIEAVVLGCTELPLLFNNVSLPVTSLDTLEIHIAKLLDVMGSVAE